MDIIRLIQRIPYTCGARRQDLSANVVQDSLIVSTPALVKCMKAAVANGMAEALRKPEPIQFDPTTDDHDDGSNVYNRVTNCFYEIMKSMVKQMLVDIIRECNN